MAMIGPNAQSWKISHRLILVNDHISIKICL